MERLCLRMRVRRREMVNIFRKNLVKHNGKHVYYSKSLKKMWTLSNYWFLKNILIFYFLKNIKIYKDNVKQQV